MEDQREVIYLILNVLFPLMWLVIYTFKIGLRNKYRLRQQYVRSNLILFGIAASITLLVPFVFLHYSFKTMYFAISNDFSPRKMLYSGFFAYAYLFAASNFLIYEYKTYLREICVYYFYKKNSNKEIDFFQSNTAIELYLFSSNLNMSRTELLLVESILEKRIFNLQTQMNIPDSFFDEQILTKKQCLDIYIESLEYVRSQPCYTIAGEIYYNINKQLK